ncbi:MAG: 50S ribosomal protein L39e [Nitrososphaerota archaeon]|nr:50S ribosomal protein L39e [Nitrososphaerota archaeon]
MSKNKTSGEKKRLMKALRQNSAPPAWITVRTNRRVRRNPKQRQWRSQKLKD